MKLNRISKVFVCTLSMFLGLTVASANTVTSMGGYFHDFDKKDASDGNSIGIVTIDAGELGTAYIGDATIRKHDVNGDGVVNAQDIIDLRSYIVNSGNYDIDGNKKVDNADLTLLTEAFNQYELSKSESENISYTENEIAVMDYNGDGDVDIIDLVLLRAIVVKKISHGQYSINNGYMPNGTQKRGDVDNDGKVDIVDVAHLRNYIVNGDSNRYTYILNFLDFNEDEVINSQDISLYETYLNGTSQYSKISGDINNDNEIDIEDAKLLRAFLCRIKDYTYSPYIQPNEGYRVSKITINGMEILAKDFGTVEINDSFEYREKNEEVYELKTEGDSYPIHISVSTEQKVDISGLKVTANNKLIEVEYEKIDTTTESEVNVDDTAMTASMIMMGSGIIAIGAGTTMLILIKKKKNEEV